MTNRSHITNFNASGFDRTSGADKMTAVAQDGGMARRGIPAGETNWFLAEWVRYFRITKQTKLMEMTGWSKATTSQLLSGKQDYSPKIVNEAAKALKVAPFELLMRPEEAMAFRRLRMQALTIVETGRDLPANDQVNVGREANNED